MDNLSFELDIEGLKGLYDLDADPEKSPLLDQYKKDLAKESSEATARGILSTLNTRAKIAALQHRNHVTVCEVPRTDIVFPDYAGNVSKVNLFWGRRVPIEWLHGTSGEVARQLIAKGYKPTFERKHDLSCLLMLIKW